MLKWHVRFWPDVKMSSHSPCAGQSLQNRNDVVPEVILAGDEDDGLTVYHLIHQGVF